MLVIKGENSKDLVTYKLALSILNKFISWNYYKNS